MDVSKVIYTLIESFENRIKNNIGIKEVNELSLKNLKDWVEKNK